MNTPVAGRNPFCSLGGHERRFKKEWGGNLKVCCAGVLKPAAREHSVIGNFGKLRAFCNIPAHQGNLFINS